MSNQKSYPMAAVRDYLVVLRSSMNLLIYFNALRGNSLYFNEFLNMKYSYELIITLIIYIVSLLICMYMIIVTCEIS